jgi:hypothetical protein
LDSRRTFSHQFFCKTLGKRNPLNRIFSYRQTINSKKRGFTGNQDILP